MRNTYQRIVITGALGFIGHHMVEHFYRNTNAHLILIDKLSYATKGLERLRSMNLLHDPRLQLFTFDLTLPIPPGLVREIGEADAILHLAAETHVDNSIRDPVGVVSNNVLSTLHILEFARSLPSLKRFIYFSTDEVYGSAPPGVAFSETDLHAATNPYSASKAAGEQLCIAYENTYQVPILISNCMNVFGERQHVEKFIPKIIKAIRDNECIEIHADKTCTIPGSRSYIHARNVASAILYLLHHGHIRERYHIVGEQEIDNLEMVLRIGAVMNKEPQYTLVDFHSNRPGHDMRYALNGNKLANLGWKPPCTFGASLEKVVNWTLAHPEWLEWDDPITFR